MKTITKYFVLICFLIASLSGCAEKPQEKIYRVGVLVSVNELISIFDGFKEKMTELGYIEGENIVYELYIAPNPVGNEQIIQKYVDEKVDLIFSFATEAAIEAKAVAEGTGVPVVFTCTFIEGTGLVNSVSSPGGDITGVRYPTTESATGRLEYLHEIAPNAKRIFVPYLNGYPTTSPQIEVLRTLASDLNLNLIEGPFATPQEVKAYLDERAASSDIGMDAILMMAEPFSVIPEVFNEVYKFADEHNLPVSSFMVFKEAYGPIIGFHPTNTNMGSMAAIQADKVLKGIPAGTLPVFTSDNDLNINYKLIQKMGLNVSEGLLARAYEIVR
ncbi:ABC transporter substrate-binding protein [Candidatus Woesearchaeota archaeon]|nr:ABC transporter substrate-binding protein [Candidatus Woesearchaeota archaeon]